MSDDKDKKDSFPSLDDYMAEPSKETDNVFSISDSKPKAAGARKKGKASLEKPLIELFTMLGATVYVADQYCGERIMAGAESLAKSLDEAAKQSDSLYKALSGLVETSVWGGVIMSFGLIAIPILAHHGIIPPALAVLTGAPEPERKPKEPRVKREKTRRGQAPQPKETSFQAPTQPGNVAAPVAGNGNAPGPAAIPLIP